MEVHIPQGRPTKIYFEILKTVENKRCEQRFQFWGEKGKAFFDVQLWGRLKSRIDLVNSLKVSCLAFTSSVNESSSSDRW